MVSALPAFHTKAAETAQQRNEDARTEGVRASHFLLRVDELLAELAEESNVPQP